MTKCLLVLPGTLCPHLNAFPKSILIYLELRSRHKLLPEHNLKLIFQNFLVFYLSHLFISQSCFIFSSGAFPRHKHRRQIKTALPQYLLTKQPSISLPEINFQESDFENTAHRKYSSPHKCDLKNSPNIGHLKNLNKEEKSYIFVQKAIS